MTFIDPTAASAPTAGAAAPTNKPATGLNQLDNSQTFLNLLVTQLKNQNPDNPADPTAFMTEIAQLTAVQSQTTLDADEETVAANSMIGKEVSGVGANGANVSGTVAGVLINSSGGAPTLELAGNAGTMSLSAVASVYAAANPPSTPSSSQ